MGAPAPARVAARPGPPGRGHRPGHSPATRSSRQYRSQITRSRGCSEEAAMARRLYYQDSYGRVHRDRSAERSRGLPGGLFAKFLIALAVLVVLAQLVR